MDLGDGGLEKLEMARTISVNDSFQEALSEFKQRLTLNEQKDFENTTIEDVRREIHRVQEDQARRKKMMNLTRISSFLEAMEQFGKVVEVFLNASDFLAFIWGPLKFFLQVGNSKYITMLRIPMSHPNTSKSISANIPIVFWFLKLC